MERPVKIERETETIGRKSFGRFQRERPGPRLPGGCDSSGVARSCELRALQRKIWCRNAAFNGDNRARFEGGTMKSGEQETKAAPIWRTMQVFVADVAVMNDHRKRQLVSAGRERRSSPRYHVKRGGGAARLRTGWIRCAARKRFHYRWNWFFPMITPAGEICRARTEIERIDVWNIVSGSAEGRDPSIIICLLGRVGVR